MTPSRQPVPPRHLRLLPGAALALLLLCPPMGLRVATAGGDPERFDIPAGKDAKGGSLPVTLEALTSQNGALFAKGYNTPGIAQGLAECNSPDNPEANGKGPTLLTPTTPLTEADGPLFLPAVGDLAGAQKAGDLFVIHQIRNDGSTLDKLWKTALGKELGSTDDARKWIRHVNALEGEGVTLRSKQRLLLWCKGRPLPAAVTKPDATKGNGGDRIRRVESPSSLAPLIQEMSALREQVRQQSGQMEALGRWIRGLLLLLLGFVVAVVVAGQRRFGASAKSDAAWLRAFAEGMASLPPAPVASAPAEPAGDPADSGRQPEQAPADTTSGGGSTATLLSKSRAWVCQLVRRLRARWKGAPAVAGGETAPANAANADARRKGEEWARLFREMRLGPQEDPMSKTGSPSNLSAVAVEYGGALDQIEPIHQGAWHRDCVRLRGFAYAVAGSSNIEAFSSDLEWLFSFGVKCKEGVGAQVFVAASPGSACLRPSSQKQTIGKKQIQVWSTRNVSRDRPTAIVADDIADVTARVTRIAELTCTLQGQIKDHLAAMQQALQVVPASPVIQEQRDRDHSAAVELAVDEAVNRVRAELDAEQQAQDKQQRQAHEAELKALRDEKGALATEIESLKVTAQQDLSRRNKELEQRLKGQQDAALSELRGEYERQLAELRGREEEQQHEAERLADERSARARELAPPLATYRERLESLHRDLLEWPEPPINARARFIREKRVGSGPLLNAIELLVVKPYPEWTELSVRARTDPAVVAVLQEVRDLQSRTLLLLAEKYGLTPVPMAPGDRYDASRRDCTLAGSIVHFDPARHHTIAQIDAYGYEVEEEVATSGGQQTRKTLVRPAQVRIYYQGSKEAPSSETQEGGGATASEFASQLQGLRQEHEAEVARLRLEIETLRAYAKPSGEDAPTGAPVALGPELPGRDTGAGGTAEHEAQLAGLRQEVVGLRQELEAARGGAGTCDGNGEPSQALAEALERQREDLVLEHQRTLAQAQDAHEAAVQKLRDQHQRDLDAARAAAGQGADPLSRHFEALGDVRIDIGILPGPIARPGERIPRTKINGDGITREGEYRIRLTARGMEPLYVAPLAAAATDPADRPALQLDDGRLIPGDLPAEVEELTLTVVDANGAWGEASIKLER